MKHLRQQTRKPGACKAQVKLGRVGILIPGTLLVLILATLALVLWATNGGIRSRTAVAYVAHVLPAISSEVRQRLVGRWLRQDGDYILGIQGVGEDGSVRATYHNPRPINVATAQAKQEEQRTDLYVELRDRGYPGSYYTLSYEAVPDQLRGLYYHAGLGQTFDVTFERMR